MKKFGALSLFAAVALISCFMPITEKVVFAVEDSRSPVIFITSPDESSVYMSQVIIRGYVRDDSLESGDNKGSLSSLSVTASPSQDHKGKIEIDSDGSYKADTDFGKVSGSNFTYNSKDKSFTVKINTADYNSRVMYITMRAVDRNGNESRKNFELLPSAGPYINLSSPSGSTYIPTSGVAIRGRVANSESQKNKYDELSSLRLQIPLLGIDVTLDISGDADAQVSLPTRLEGATLRYVKSNSTFTCDIDLLEDEINRNLVLTIKVIAKDRNKNSKTVDRTIRPVSSNPTINSRLSVHRNYYYSAFSPPPSKPFYSPPTSKLKAGNYDSLDFEGTVEINNPDVNTAPELRLSFSNSSISNTVTVTPARTIDPDVFRFGNSVTVGTNLLNRGGGTITVRLTVTDNQGGRTEKIWRIQEDSTAPVFSNISITTSTNSRYVGTSSTVTLRFTVSDDGTGIDISTLAGEVAGIPLANFTTSKSGNRFVCSKAVSLASATQTTSGDLDIAISVKDNIGNIKTVDENSFDYSSSDQDSEVQFVHGAPVLSTISITSKRSGFNTAALPGDTVELVVTSPQALDPGEFIATIAGVGATVRETGHSNTLHATAVIPNDYTTNPIPFEITAFENSIGTAGTGTPISSTTDSTSVTCWPKLSDVSITFEKGGSNSRNVPESGDKVILSFNVASSPALHRNPEVSFTLDSSNLTPVTWDNKVSAPAYRYTYTIKAADVSGSRVRPVNYSIAFSDGQGNSGVVGSGASTLFGLRPGS